MARSKIRRAKLFRDLYSFFLIVPTTLWVVALLDLSPLWCLLISAVLGVIFFTLNAWVEYEVAETAILTPQLPFNRVHHHAEHPTFIDEPFPLPKDTPFYH